MGLPNSTSDLSPYSHTRWQPVKSRSLRCGHIRAISIKPTSVTFSQLRNFKVCKFQHPAANTFKPISSTRSQPVKSNTSIPRHRSDKLLNPTCVTNGKPATYNSLISVQVRANAQIPTSLTSTQPVKLKLRKSGFMFATSCTVTSRITVPLSLACSCKSTSVLKLPKSSDKKFRKKLRKARGDDPPLFLFFILSLFCPFVPGGKGSKRTPAPLLFLI